MKGKILGLALGVATAVVWAPAAAQTAHAMKQQVEARMLVTGSIDIEPDGRVSAVSLDEVEKIPDAVVDLVERAAAQWRFEPILVDGAPVPARAPMSLKVLANKMQDRRGEFAVRLDAAYFGQSEYEAGESPTAVQMKAPNFPEALLRAGVSGTVYLVLKIGRDGSVEDAVVEQVNLYIAGDAREMERWRKNLSTSALAAARKWTFAGPRKGDEVDAPFWSIRVPVNYRFSDDPGPQVGRWEVYIPGPRQNVVWLTEDESSVQPDALAADGVHPVGHGRRLLTALDPGT